MTDAPSIDDLLAGRWRRPDGTAGAPLPIRRVVIAPALDGLEAELIAAQGLGRRLAVVADPNTWEALGRRVAQALAAIATVDEVVLAAPTADEAAAADLAGRTRHADALIAVGSGTLNDLCKYAAFATGRPYAVFASAPSMNGYVTGTASLSRAGHKSTLAAACPRAALFDLAVLAQAPMRLIRAGIGDVLCRTTAQADWLLAHLLRGTPYDELPFLWQADDEPRLLGEAAAMVAGEAEAIRTLTRLLVLSGLGMVQAGSSAPGSQAEHLVGHYLDMMCHEQGPGRLHGEQVGVATLAISRLQHRVLAAPAPPGVRATRIDEAAILQHFGTALGRQCLAELRAKALDEVAAERLNARLAADWRRITARLRRVMLPTADLTAALSAAGAPTTAADLGLSSDTWRLALTHAREVRNRFTILDLAADAGLLDGFVAGER
jgi:glycerol-1-phosphate dehydrogenase [NAD(P)+]